MTPVLMVPLAVTAGVLSFTSPCVLPLLPGYLAYMTGLPADATEEGTRHLRIQAALLFVAGFSAVFTLLGTGVALAGGRVARHVPLLTRASGVVLVVAGLLTAGLVRTPLALLREHRPGLAAARRGPGGALVLGAAFAAGWTPCMGPVLASILMISAGSSTTAWGATLLLLYSLGLGIPFVLVAASTGRARWLPWLRAHTVGLQRTGGVVLAAVGVLLLSGAWERLMQPMQRMLANLRWPPV